MLWDVMLQLLEKKSNKQEMVAQIRSPGPAAASLQQPVHYCKDLPKAESPFEI